MTTREYNTIHQWVLRHYVKTGTCTNCNRVCRTQWSNKTGKYLKLERMDWQELCTSCHQKYDELVLGKTTLSQMAKLAHASSKWKEAVKRGGFASMTPERRREIARKGGLNSKRGKSIGVKIEAHS